MASHPGESKDSRYDRDSINAATKKSHSKPANPIQLTWRVFQQTAAETIQQTADYARDPRTYLEATIGNRVLDERKELLSIPRKIDRDVYGVGEHKKQFEQHIARLFGKEHGLFFITGIQAQLIAMKIHCARAGKDKVAWHVTSHLEFAEEDAYTELYGLERILFGSNPDKLPTVDEIKSVLALPEKDRPAAILIEIPNRVLGCQTYSYSELRAISIACREAHVRFHMDGARIWEIEPYYQQRDGKTFSDIAKLFDSMYVSFYKGLRGAAGAMLMGPDANFIEEAKRWQRRAGGTAVQLTYEVVDCERGYNENIGTFDIKWVKMGEIVDGVTTATARYKNDEGESIVQFWPEKATCSQIRTAFVGFTSDELIAARDKVQEKLNVRIFERTFKDPRKRWKELDTDKTKHDTEDDKEALAEVPRAAEAKGDENTDETRHMIEWQIVSATLNLETKLFVDSYVQLCEELIAGRKS